MANSFTSYQAKNVGTSPVTLTTAAASSQVTLIGATICNTTSSTITASLYITRSAIDYYLVYNVPVPSGKTFVAIGGDQKTVLIPSDALKVVTNTATSADVIVSALVLT